MVRRLHGELQSYRLHPGGGVTFEEFFADEVARLRSKATDLARYGCIEAAGTCEANATDLEAAFRGYWLAELTISDAARESGYSEERLRQMARDSEIPSKKGDGPKGHLSICRRDLPRRPVPVETPVSDIGTRLLGKRQKPILRPAS